MQHLSASHAKKKKKKRFRFMLNTTHSNSPASLLRYSICRQNLVLFVKRPVYNLVCPGLLQLIDDAHPQFHIPAIRFTLLQYFIPSVLFHDADESPVVRLWIRTSPVTQQLAKIVTFHLNWELPVCSAYARLCLRVWSVILWSVSYLTLVRLL